VGKRILLYKRDQIQLLCEAKRIVAKEFNENLTLQSDDMIERLLKYSEKSNDQRLNTIYSKIMLSQIAIRLNRNSKK